MLLQCSIAPLFHCYIAPFLNFYNAKLLIATLHDSSIVQLQHCCIAALQMLHCSFLHCSLSNILAKEWSRNWVQVIFVICMNRFPHFFGDTMYLTLLETIWHYLDYVRLLETSWNYLRLLETTYDFLRLHTKCYMLHATCSMLHVTCYMLYGLFYYLIKTTWYFWTFPD